MNDMFTNTSGLTLRYEQHAAHNLCECGCGQSGTYRVEGLVDDTKDLKGALVASKHADSYSCALDRIRGLRKQRAKFKIGDRFQLGNRFGTIVGEGKWCGRTIVGEGKWCGREWCPLVKYDDECQTATEPSGPLTLLAPSADPLRAHRWNSSLLLPSIGDKCLDCSLWPEDWIDSDYPACSKQKPMLEEMANDYSMTRQEPLCADCKSPFTPNGKLHCAYCYHRHMLNAKSENVREKELGPNIALANIDEPQQETKPDPADWLVISTATYDWP